MQKTLKQTPEELNLEKAAHSLHHMDDLTVLMHAIGDAKYVLLGEASHGTHEYYTWRAHITKRLIKEKKFSIVAVEGDWSDCYRLNRYIKGYADSGKNARDVLNTFNRWPTWIWANWEMVALAEWLRTYNNKLPMEQKAGFYGLDVYSLWESMETITNYLQRTDPEALESVIKVMQRFEPYNVKEGLSNTGEGYGLSVPCRKQVEKLLTEIRLRMPLYDHDYENGLNEEQNAMVNRNAEKYYHEMLCENRFTRETIVPGR
ncbi:MAG TPA: erythromycin esterase family protein [Bacteroidia bacterium]|nr:erythromycin esterase family protein [Bacteroidia bacterium]